MAYNGIVGKNKKKGTTKKNGRSYAAQKIYNATPKQRKKRAELNKIARARGIYGKRHSKGVDLSHTKSGKVVLEKRSKNRARNGAGGKSRLK